MPDITSNLSVRTDLEINTEGLLACVYLHAANEHLAIGHGHKRACGIRRRRARRSTGAVVPCGADAWSAKSSAISFTARARRLGRLALAAHRFGVDDQQRQREDGAEHVWLKC